MTVALLAKSYEEESRSGTLGVLRGRVYLAIWTERNDGIRLISVRRARENEEKITKTKIIQNDKSDG